MGKAAKEAEAAEVETPEVEVDELLDEMFPRSAEPEGDDDDEPEAEPKEEEPEEEPEDEEEPEPDATATAKAGGLPKRAIDELQKKRRESREARKTAEDLRAENDLLRQQVEARQAPPMPGDHQRQTAARPAGADEAPPIPVVVGEDGQQYLDPAAVDRYLQARDVARQPTPQQMAAQTYQQSRHRIVSENPAIHGPLLTRAETAYERLELLTRQATLQTGVQTRSPEEWRSLMESTGALQRFAADFPDLAGEVDEFADVSVRAQMGDVRPSERWFRRWAAAQQASEAEEGEEAEEGDEEDAEPAVKALPKGRPRSMAKKGASPKDSEGDDGARYKRLLDAANADPLGLEDPEGKQRAELRRLARRLKIVDPTL